MDNPQDSDEVRGPGPGLTPPSYSWPRFHQYPGEEGLPLRARRRLWRFSVFSEVVQ